MFTINNPIFASYLLFFLGYVLLYLARQTIPIALPILINLEHTSHLELSYLFACFSLFYGIFKFINGIVMDLKSCPLFMFGLGQIISGLATISIPFLYSHSTLCLLIIILLAWAQGTGWPAITKFITKNFDTHFVASLWGIMSISHQLGSCISLAILPNIVHMYSPKHAFLYSGFLCLLFGLYIMLHNNHRRRKKSLLFVCELRNLMKFLVNIKISLPILLLCYATFCTYIVRMGIFFWFPLVLKDILQISLVKSSLITGIHDLGGILGALVTGRLSDVYFPKSRSLLASIYMLVTAFIFIAMNFYNNLIFLFLSAALSGFLIFGVQVLTGVIASEIAPKNNVCTIVSLTGLFGYVSSSIFSCVGLGLIMRYFGNSFIFLFLFISSVIASICFRKLVR